MGTESSTLLAPVDQLIAAAMKDLRNSSKETVDYAYRRVNSLITGAEAEKYAEADIALAEQLSLKRFDVPQDVPDDKTYERNNSGVMIQRRAEAEELLLKRFDRGAIGRGVMPSVYTDQFLTPNAPQFTQRRPIVPPSKTAVAVSDPGGDPEYRALARELGGYDANMVNAELEAFLVENFIEEYPLQSVIDYMNELCFSAQPAAWDRVRWLWHPYRRQDVIRGSRASETWRQQYSKPVPYPVLETIKRIAGVFQDAVRFCVTDVETVPDPFLAVGAKTAEGVYKFHVIERWDEPKYRP